MLPKRITNFLEKHNVNYEILEHKTVYTAFDAAQTLGKKLSEIAKTLAVKADRKYFLLVIPADRKVDFEKLERLLKVKKAKIVKEIDIKKIFKVNPGTLIPFVAFHKIPVYLDKTLLKNRIVIVSGGSHTESVKLKVNDLLEQGAEAITTFSKKHKFKKIKVNKPKAKKKTTAKKADVKKKISVNKKSAKKRKNKH
ncbi:YbaK/EbsC family protein [Candidatus Parcubacteria bacterium]|nr:YbaK/EbsC family protein [Candidatus Parcubacteria bacterium]